MTTDTLFIPNNLFAPAPANRPDADELQSRSLNGTVETVICYKEDSGWAVVEITTPRGRRKVSGIMPDVKKGISAAFTGEWVTSERYGPTFKAASYVESLPSDVEGIEKYLASGLIRNIGPVLAKQIVATFGEMTLAVLDNEPERLSEVYGIGKKRLSSIVEAVRDQTAIRTIMIWLKRYSIPNGLAVKIYKAYGDASVRMLEENPYRLSDDIGGVGFRKADEVALRIGIARESPFRIRSGIRACLEDNASDGNTCMEHTELLNRVSSADYLGIDPTLVENELRSSACPTATSGGMVFLRSYYNAEKKIAERIRSIQNTRSGPVRMPDIDALSKATGVTYSKEQREAILMAATSKMSIITGGPGTGKTVTTNAVIREFEDRGFTVLLAAPTGRAAKRMNEVTGHEAKTIHRLLEFKGDRFERNEENPLDGDALIIDEASMIDTLLMKHLLAAVPDTMRVVIVGDVDQLPSVGAGCVLRDIIDSGCVPVQHLKEIFRQAQGSDIIMNAHAVNEGRIPNIVNRDGTDFWFFGCDDISVMPELITDIVVNRVPKKFGFDTKDIQVLSPMKREFDAIGSMRLNQRLQQALNPDGKPVSKYGETEFRIGDKVMQTKNDYEKDIFNGDMGVILSAHDESDEKKTLLTVDFDGVAVGLSRSDLANLELAYACTVHKSQGSEYPVIVMPVHESQYIMLKRNLLYTAITRSRKECILVGTRRALAIAVNNEDTRKRITMLKERLIEC